MNKYEQLITQIENLTLPKNTKDDLIKQVDGLKKWNSIYNPNFYITDSNKYKPKTVEVGDLVTIASGLIVHPGLVYKILDKEDKVFIIGFTTNENYKGVIGEMFSSRFLKDSCLTASMQVMSKDEALRYWTGTLGNKVLCKKLLDQFENYYVELIGKTKIKRKLK